MTAPAADVTHASYQPASVVLRAMLAHNVGVRYVQNAVCLGVCMCACACVCVSIVMGTMRHGHKSEKRLGGAGG